MHVHESQQSSRLKLQRCFVLLQYCVFRVFGGKYNALEHLEMFQEDDGSLPTVNLKNLAL